MFFGDDFGDVFMCDLFVFFCWGPGIEGRLTGESDSEAKAVRTDEKSCIIMKNKRKLCKTDKTDEKMNMIEQR